MKRQPPVFTVTCTDHTGRELTPDELAAWGRSARTAGVFGRLMADADRREPEAAADSEVRSA